MQNITLKTNARAVVLELQGAEQEVRSKAMARALNRMIDQVKTASAREIVRVGYKLKASTIKKGLRIQRATPGTLRASIVARGRPIPLIEYSARQTTRGVSVSVLNGRKVIKSSFIATMKTGHKGVFAREADAKHRKVKTAGKTSWHALPITELYGPSLPDGMANAHVQAALQQLVAEKFADLFEHEVKWLERRGRR